MKRVQLAEEPLKLESRSFYMEEQLSNWVVTTFLNTENFIGKVLILVTLIYSKWTV